MTLTTDDFRRLSDRARARVDRVRADVAQQVTQPDTERQDLAEYNAMTPDEHAQVYREVGAERYQEYVDTMERLKLKHQPQGE